MCSAADDPTTYDRKPTTPRRYVLAGGEEPRPSVALAVLGTMLTEAESDLRVVENSKTGATTVAMARAVVDALRRARNRVAAAETGR
jgi:hypothetical protein